VSNHRGQDDDGLLGELRERLGTDPPPPAVVAAARAAFALRGIDAELAALVADSAADDRPLAGVRGATEGRLLTFESAAVTIELEVSPGRDGNRVVGQLAPSGPGAVEILHSGGTTAVEADAHGRFAVGGVPPGPFRLRCRPPDADRPVHTDWTILGGRPA